MSGQPDLTITSLTAPASAIEGNAATITVGWTVQNHGTAAADAPWTDAVYLSSAATLNADSVQIASLDESLQAPLAPDASYTISHQITLPEFAGGDDYLIVRTNDGGSLDEATVSDDLDSRPLELNPPDVALAVTSATATGPSGDNSVAAGDGQKLNVSWAVQNQGGETAMATWSDAVYLSRDNTLDGTDQLLDTQSLAPQAPLASSDSYTQYDSIVVPDTTITGDHFLLVVPDADHGQGESSGAGGAFAVPIKITPTSDVNLALTNPTVSTQAVEEGNGQQIDVSYTVKNTGTAPALSAWTDAIYLSKSQTIDSSAVKLDYAPGPSQAALGSGASYTENTTVDVPILAPGSYYLLIETDSGDVQSEADKSDNLWSSQVITVSPPQVDLVMTATAPATATVGDGHEISVSYTVTNQGSEAATGYWTNAVYLSDKPTLDDTARRIQSLPTGILGTTNNLSFSLPGNITGEEYLLFVANDRSDQNAGQDETDFANNVCSRPINVTSSNIDLALSDASYVDESGNVPASVEAGNGQQVYLRWTAQNRGSSASGPWGAQAYLANDSNLSASSIPLGLPFIESALSPSQSQVTSGWTMADGLFKPGTPSVTVPNVSAGTYDLLVVADTDDQQGELRMTNNAVAMPITLTTPDVNLQVTAPDAPATAVAGGTIHLTWEVANQGSEGASGGWTDEVYISDVQELTPSAQQLTTLVTDSGETLGPHGASTTLQQDVAIPAATGQRWLLFVTNATRTQGETNYADDVRAVPITITNGLAASNVSAPSQVILGQSFDVSWAVTNTIDTTTNGTWTDQVYVSPSPNFDQVGLGDLWLVGSFSNPKALDTNESYPAQQTVSFSGFSTPPLGQTYYLIVVPGDGAPAVSQPISLAAPDLAISAVSPPSVVPSTVTPGEAVQVSWTVENQASVDAAANWVDAMYLSNDDTFGPGDVFVGSFDHTGLLAHESYNASGTITIPGNASGSPYLLFVTNPFGLFQPESDEESPSRPGANNVWAVQINVTDPKLTVAVNTSPSTPLVVGNNAAFELDYTVSNQGSVPTNASSWVDKLYVSDKSTFDGSAQFIGDLYTNNATLSAGGGYYEVDDTDLKLPNLPATDQYLLIVTDANGGQVEANGEGGDNTDNVAAVPITPQVPNVNLVPSASGTPPTIIYQGDTPTFTVTNDVTSGGDTASAGWTDALYFSTSSTLDQNAVLLESDEHSAPLAPGESYPFDGSIPALPLGPGYLLFVTNVDGTQGESDVSDDTYSVPVTVAAADLAISDASVSQTPPTLGQLVNLSWTVRNQGGAPAAGSWADAVYLSDKPTYDGSATLLGEFQENANAPLAQNQTYTDTESITIPAAVPGDILNDYLLVIANASAGQQEADGGGDGAANNLFAVSLGALAPNRLQVADVAAPTSGLSGQGFEVSWIDENEGTQATVGAWTDSVYLSTDTQPAHGALIAQISMSQPLAAGASLVSDHQFLLPGTPGSYFVIVTTDADGPWAGSREIAVSELPIQVAPVDLPDLVASVDTPSDGFLSGTAVPVTYTVTNNGNVPTTVPTWYDYVFLSQNPYLSFAGYTSAYSDQAINNVVVVEDKVQPVAVPNAGYLAPGDSYTQTVDVTLPADTAGPWYAYAVADGLGGHFLHRSQVAEGNEANNLAVSGASFNVTLAPTPDLQVTSVESLPQLLSGQTATVSWTVTNGGNGAVPDDENDWIDAVYLSTTPTLAQGALPLASRVHVGGFASRASYTDTQSVSLPDGISGTYYFIVKTDVDGQVFQNGYTGNDVLASSAVNVNPTSPPDLLPTITSVPESALASHELSISYQVKNVGYAATPNAAWTDSFYLSPTSDPGTQIKLGDVTHSGALNAGNSYSGTAKFTLPDGLSGPYDVLLETDSGNAVFEQSESNNLTPPVNEIELISQPADLVATPVISAGSAIGGQGLNVSWTVTNRGQGDTAVSDWVDMVYAQQGTTLDINTAVLLGAFHHQGLLAAQASYTQSQVVTIPIGFSGDYNLFIYADAPVTSQNDVADAPTGPGGSVYEGDNEGNNVSAPATLDVTQSLSDLIVTNVTVNSPAATGGSLAVSWTVKNLSDAAATNANGWYDDVYLSPSTTFDSQTATYLGSVYHNSALAAGGSYGASATFTVPVAFAANDGSYYVIVRADRPSQPHVTDDGVNQVTESDETNNDHSSPAINVELSPTPDLTVSNVVVPNQALTGQPLDISWTVTNPGAAAPAQSWYDTVYLSVGSTFSRASSIYLGSIASPAGLANDASYSRDETFTLPGGVLGVYYVFVVADVNGAVFERANTGDKVALGSQQLAITLPPPGDLAAGTVTTVPDQGQVGDAVSIGYTVTNDDATTALQGDWQDALYLSSTGVWQPSDLLLGEVAHSGGLAAGASYNGTLNTTLPDVTPGDYYVILRSDVRGQAPETDENNNLSASGSAITITVPTLTPGAPASGTLEQGQEALYQVTAQPGQTLEVNLTGDDSDDLYVSYAQAPTRAQFDLHANAPTAGQQLLVPSTLAGTYYVLVYRGALTGSDAYSITASFVQFAVTSVTPNAIGNAGPATLEIDGAKFDRDTTFELDGQGNVLPATSVTWQSSTTAFATFNVAGAALGSYTVRAVAADGTPANLTGGLSIGAGAGGQLRVGLNIPSLTLVNHENTFQVNYMNGGDAAMGAPLLMVVSPTGTGLGAAADLVDQLGPLDVLGVSPSGPAGVLRAGESASLPVWFSAGVQPGPYQFDVYATTADDPQPVDWSAVEAYVSPSFTSLPNWSDVWADLQTRIGPNATWGDFVRMLDRNATQTVDEGDGENSNVAALVDLEAERAVADVGSSISGSVHLADADITVAGQLVEATNTASGEVVATRSLADGSFIFDQIGAGDWQISFQDALVTDGGAVTVAADTPATVALELSPGAALSGKVLAQENSAPIASASVSVVGALGSDFNVYSDANGNYTLAGLPADTYTVTVEAPGRARTVIADLALSAGTTERDVTLAAESTISGTVTLAPGGPAADALSVVATPSPADAARGQFATSIEGPGDFTLSGLPAGTYDIRVSMAGYLPQTLTAVVGAGNQTDLNTLIELEPAATISGTVTSDDPNVPASGLQVGAFLNGVAVATATTDPSGAYTLAGLAPATYTVGPLTKSDYLAPATVTLVGGENATGIDLQLEPGGEIDGTVTDAQGAPLAHVPVLAADGTGDASQATTDDNGAFQFSGLATGAWTVSLSHSVTTADTSKPVQIDSLTGAPQQVSLQATGIEGSIAGRLLSSSGSPIAGGTVDLYQAGSLLASATSASDGTYTIYVGQGPDFDLQARGDGASFAPVTGVSVVSGAVIQDITAGDASLAITATDAAQSLVGDIVALSYQSAPGSPPAGRATLDATGEVTFSNLAAGTYNVAITGANDRGITASVTVADGAAVPEPLALEQQGNLTGTVSDASALPVAGAQVTLALSTDTSQVWHASTNADGNYSIDNVPSVPGATYDVTVRATGVDSTSASLTITGDPKNFTLASSAHSLSGILVDSAGHGVAGATISVEGQDAQATTNTDGTYTLNGVMGTDLTLVLASGGKSFSVPYAFDGGTSSLPQLTFPSDSVIDEVASLASFGVGVAGPFLLAPSPSAPPTLAEPQFSALPAAKECADEYREALDAIQEQADAAREVQEKAEEAQDDAEEFASEFAGETADFLSRLTNFATAAQKVSAAVFESNGAGGVYSTTIGTLEQIIDGLLADVDNLKVGFTTVELAQLDADRDSALGAVESLAGQIQAAATPLFADTVRSVSEELLDDAHELDGEDPYSETIDALSEALDAIQEVPEKALEYAKKTAEAVEKIKEYNECVEKHKKEADRHGTKFAGGGGEAGTAVDPNEIIGPRGYGDQHFVAADQPLSYQIDFENEPSAGAPAQDVTVTDQLDPSLDWGTFRLGDFGWGGMTFSPPPNSAYYQTTVDETAEHGFDVLVTATIDAQTGIATWDLETIDPATWRKPADPSEGFLPPDDGNGAGEGFVSYSVMPAASAASGTIIDAQATVTFDTQPPLSTAQIFNTLDSGDSLSSQVAPLAANQSNLAFNVSWFAEPEATGASAVATYSVYVSDDGGPFAAWLTNVAFTQLSFNGQAGHTYSFYSLAEDSAGNQQTSASAMPQTTTIGGAVSSASASTIAAVEAQAFSGVVATFAAGGAADDFLAAIDWGDGLTSAGTIAADPNGGYDVVGSHVYGEEGTGLSLQVVIQDLAGDLVTAEGEADVSDAPLTGEAAAIAPTQDVAFTGAVATFTDADPAGAVGDYSATIDWGDGQHTTGTITGAGGTFTVSGSSTYAEERTVTVSVAITDNGGATLTVASTTNVADAPLTGEAAVIAPTQDVAFTGAVATFTDADPAGAVGDYSATIDWGDGQHTTGTITGAGGVFTVTGSNTYAEEGPVTVSVSIMDAGGATLTVTSTTNVADAPLSGAALAVTAVEGAAFTGAVATFTDADPAGAVGDYSATIDWGDGQHTMGTITGAGGVFTVSGSNTYAEEGTVTVSVSIKDAGGAAMTVTRTTNVADAPLTGLPLAVTAVEGAAFTGAVATFTDADPAGALADYTATIKWGDGHISTGTISGPDGNHVFTVSGTNTYAQAGPSTVTVTVDDRGGASAVVLSAVNVVAPPAAYADRFVVNLTGGSSAGAAQGVLSNDVDTNANPHLAASLVSGPAHGAVTLNSDGSFTYTPGAGFQGVDRFSYQVHDGPAYGNTATVTVYSHSGDLVQKLYQSILGRDALDSDIAYWAPALDNGSASTAMLLQALYYSAEHLNPLVNAFYETYLGFAADAYALSYWENVWISYGGPEQVIIGIAATDSCFAHVGNNNTAWVNAMYVDILGRAADPTSLNYLVAALNSGSMNRVQVVQELVASDEYRSHVIQAFYQNLLGRAASGSDVSSWQTLFDNGATQLSMQQALVGSAEFKNNPPAPSSGAVTKWS